MPDSPEMDQMDQNMD